MHLFWMKFSRGEGGGRERREEVQLNSLNAMGTFMCLYKIEKTMSIVLTIQSLPLKYNTTLCV